MMHMRWMAALAAVLLAGAPSARAGDTFRLALDNDDAPVLKLGGADSLDADTLDVGYRGGYHGGGYRGGYHGGYRAGYYGGGYRSHYYSGYRSHYYSGYRGWYGGYRGGWYGYRPYYYGWYPRWYSYGYRPYYYSSYSVGPQVYYADPCYYPTTTTLQVMPPAVSLNGGPSLRTQPTLNADTETAPPPQLQDRTFPYDGGPRSPAPMPKAEPGQTPIRAPTTLPLEGRTVSLPARTKFAYPAYGEAPLPSSFGSEREKTVVIKK